MNTLIKKIINIAILLLVSNIVMISSSCGRDNTPVETASPNKTKTGVQTQTAQPTGTANPVPTQDLSPYAVNPITGIQDMDKANEGKRPLAIIINNIKVATPQVGITTCDMYYEIPAEGGITRIMGIFADPSKIPTIGSVRSARDYYVQIAAGYNAVFAHFGTSTSAENMIKNNSINNLEGMTLAETYWRDPDRKATMGSEHSVLTSGEKLLEAITKKGYSMDIGFNGETAFKFYNQNNFTTDGNADCTKVTAKFSGSYAAEFNYDAATKLYSKNQFGAPHVDDKGNQIKVTNVIVLYTSMSVVDEQKHLSVDLSSGKGYYLSGGKVKEIKWTKGSLKEPMKYFNTDGSDLTVNAGKTYVCIVGSANNITLA